MAQDEPIDLRSLLDVPSETIKKPPVLPAGMYHGFIEKYEAKRSNTPEKTPVLKLFIKLSRADDSIPEDLLVVEGKKIDLGRQKLSKDYFLDGDSLYRLTELMGKVGIDLSGRTPFAALPELRMKPVQVQISHRASKDGTEMYNDVKDLAAEGA